MASVAICAGCTEAALRALLAEAPAGAAQLPGPTLDREVAGDASARCSFCGRAEALGWPLQRGQAAAACPECLGLAAEIYLTVPTRPDGTVAPADPQSQLARLQLALQERYPRIGHLGEWRAPSGSPPPAT